jgi:hypothetical protein
VDIGDLHHSQSLEVLRQIGDVDFDLLEFKPVTEQESEAGGGQRCCRERGASRGVQEVAARRAKIRQTPPSQHGKE